MRYQKKSQGTYYIRVWGITILNINPELTKNLSEKLLICICRVPSNSKPMELSQQRLHHLLGKLKTPGVTKPNIFLKQYLALAVLVLHLHGGLQTTRWQQLVLQNGRHARLYEYALSLHVQTRQLVQQAICLRAYYALRV